MAKTKKPLYHGFGTSNSIGQHGTGYTEGRRKEDYINKAYKTQDENTKNDKASRKAWERDLEKGGYSVQSLANLYEMRDIENDLKTETDKEQIKYLQDRYNQLAEERKLYNNQSYVNGLNTAGRVALTAYDTIAHLGRGTLSGAEGLADTVGYGIADVVGLFNEDLKDTLYDEFSKDYVNTYLGGNNAYNNAKYNNEVLDTINSMSYGIGNNVSRMLMSEVSPVLAYASMYGNSKSENLQKGKNYTDATIDAVFNSAIEYLTEQTGGLKFGEGALGKALNNKQLLKTMIEESFEELGSNALNRNYDTIRHIIDPSNPQYQNTDTVGDVVVSMLQDAAMGAAVSGVMGAPAAIENKINKNKSNNSSELKDNKQTKQTKQKENVQEASEETTAAYNKITQELANVEKEINDKNAKIEEETQQERAAIREEARKTDNEKISSVISSAEKQTKQGRKDAIKNAIDTDEEFVYSTMREIYDQQTEMEKATSETTDANGFGFSGVDAKFMSSLNEALDKNGKLTPKQLEKARNIMSKYAGQIDRIYQSMNTETKQEVKQETKQEAKVVSTTEEDIYDALVNEKGLDKLRDTDKQYLKMLKDRYEKNGKLSNSELNTVKRLIGADTVTVRKTPEPKVIETKEVYGKDIYNTEWTSHEDKYAMDNRYRNYDKYKMSDYEIHGWFNWIGPDSYILKDAIFNKDLDKQRIEIRELNDIINTIIKKVPKAHGDFKRSMLLKDMGTNRKKYFMENYLTVGNIVSEPTVVSVIPESNPEAYDGTMDIQMHFLDADAANTKTLARSDEGGELLLYPGDKYEVLDVKIEDGKYEITLRMVESAQKATNEVPTKEQKVLNKKETVENTKQYTDNAKQITTGKGKKRIELQKDTDVHIDLNNDIENSKDGIGISTSTTEGKDTITMKKGSRIAKVELDGTDIKDVEDALIAAGVVSNSEIDNNTKKAIAKNDTKLEELCIKDLLNRYHIDALEYEVDGNKRLYIINENSISSVNGEKYTPQNNITANEYIKQEKDKAAQELEAKRQAEQAEKDRIKEERRLEKERKDAELKLQKEQELKDKNEKAIKEQEERTKKAEEARQRTMEREVRDSTQKEIDNFDKTKVTLRFNDKANYDTKIKEILTRIVNVNERFKSEGKEQLKNTEQIYKEYAKLETASDLKDAGLTQDLKDVDNSNTLTDRYNNNDENITAKDIKLSKNKHMKSGENINSDLNTILKDFKEYVISDGTDIEDGMIFVNLKDNIVTLDGDNTISADNLEDFISQLEQCKKLSEKKEKIKKETTSPKKQKTLNNTGDKKLNELLTVADSNYKAYVEYNEELMLTNALKAYKKYKDAGGEVVNQTYEHLLVKQENSETLSQAKDITKETPSMEKQVFDEMVKEIQEEKVADNIEEIAADMEDEDTLVVSSTTGEALGVVSNSTAEKIEQKERAKKSLNKKEKILTPEQEKKVKQTQKTYKNNTLTRVLQKFQNQWRSIINVDKIRGDKEASAKYNKLIRTNAEAISNITDAQLDSDGNEIGISKNECFRSYDAQTEDGKVIMSELWKLKSDLERKKNAELGIEYGDTIFPGRSIEVLEAQIEYIEKNYPELAKIMEGTNSKWHGFIKNENKKQVQAGVLPETVVISEEVAKNVMGMTDEQISKQQVIEGVMVDNVEYLDKMNQYYNYTEREVVQTQEQMLRNSVKSEDAKKMVGTKKIKGLSKSDLQIVDMSDAANMFVFDKTRQNNFNSLAKTLSSVYSFEDIKSKDLKDWKKANPNSMVGTMNDGTAVMVFYETQADGSVKTRYVQIPSALQETLTRRHNNELLDFLDANSDANWYKAMKGFNTLLRETTTGMLSPMYVVKNKIKDMQEAWISSDNSIDKLPKQVGSFVRDMMSNSSDFQRFVRRGGMSTYNGLTVKDRKLVKQTKSVLGKAVGTIENINAMVEASTRYAAYKASLASGKSVDVAMLDAARSTTNFDETGWLWQGLDRAGVTVYFGAGVAGANRAADTFILSPVRGIEAGIEGIKNGSLSQQNKQDIKKAMRVAAMSALIYGVGAGINKIFNDDPEKEQVLENLPEYIKNNNYVIVNDDGSIITIPLGRQNAVANYIVKYFAETDSDDKDLQDVVTAAEFVWDAVGPNRFDKSLTASNILQAINNKDTYGNEIGTTKDRLWYIANSYGGLIADVIEYASKQSKGQSVGIPIINTYYKSADNTSLIKSGFFNKTFKYKDSDKEIDQIKYKYMYYNYYVTEISPLRKEYNALVESGADTATLKAKQKEIDALYQYATQMADNITKVGDSYTDGNGIWYDPYVDDDGVTKYRKN